MTRIQSVLNGGKQHRKDSQENPKSRGESDLNPEVDDDEVGAEVDTDKQQAARCQVCKVQGLEIGDWEDEESRDECCARDERQNWFLGFFFWLEFVQDLVEQSELGMHPGVNIGIGAALEVDMNESQVFYYSVQGTAVVAQHFYWVVAIDLAISE